MLKGEWKPVRQRVPSTGDHHQSICRKFIYEGNYPSFSGSSEIYSVVPLGKFSYKEDQWLYWRKRTADLPKHTPIQLHIELLMLQ